MPDLHTSGFKLLQYSYSKHPLLRLYIFQDMDVVTSLCENVVLA